jgi:hypothetical protein
MEEPGQRATFKFFRSYLDAAKAIPDKTMQCDFLLSICEYALNGEAPEMDGILAAMFALVKPNIDASIKKQESGAIGGSKPKANAKQIESKPQANSKQTASKPKANAKGPASEEGRRKKEEGSKDVGSTPHTPQRADFETFWTAYPKKVGKQAAWKAFSRVKEPVESLVTAIERQKCSTQWSKDAGQYIPNPATWLNGERWGDELDTPPQTAAQTAPVYEQNGYQFGESDREAIARLQRLRDQQKAGEV